MKNNMKQIEQIIKLQKEINQLDKNSIDAFDDDEYDEIQHQIMYKECDLEKLVNNLTKKKLRILVFKLLEQKDVEPIKLEDLK